MLNLETFGDPQTIISILVAIAAVAAVLTIFMPMLETDTLGRRMKAVATERDRIRAREREKLVTKKTAAPLRATPKAYMKHIVDNFNLSKWLGAEGVRGKLAAAGYRGPQAEVAFLFFRLVAPIGLFVVTIAYILMNDMDLSLATIIIAGLVAVLLGIKLPEIVLSNTTAKRQQSLRRAFPDALDLLLSCVESGMSIEHAFRKVSQEIGVQSIPLAEEFTLTTAELSYLPDRRMAYENLVARTGVDSIKQISTVLIQAERYGTPLGTALRVVAQESRDMRMSEAEKKAASLPPKLTVPMIIFFLPVLFAVIITPAAIQIMGMPSN
jgi:tight adherence protein C